jgi:hypothetical protein
MIDSVELEYEGDLIREIAQRLGDTSSHTNESQTILYATLLDQAEDGST